jgi:FG-GAP repeat
MKKISTSGNTLLCLITLQLTLLLWPGSAFAQDSGAPLLTTITNPTPAADDIFGGAVAAMGSDRVLVGAEGAAEAYLFSLNGTLLTTFTIPDPAAGSFGAALAAVGSDRVFIGAYNYTAGMPLTQAGRAYLFSTNGTLLTTFTNPAPAAVQAFGWSLAALGSDRVIIGGFANDNNGAPYPGSVYLFRTNGTLLTVLTNPTPASDGGLGISVAALGSDRVLVGAPYNNTGGAGAGSAYLYSTGGTLLTTFTNPVPAVDDNFGTAVGAVGGDRILISAIDYGGTKGTGGAAYLFNTNGVLVATFSNPTPATGDYFGWSVAALGSSRVLIGAYQDGTGAIQAGSAYLFSTNGTLLNTFTNPTPASQSWFANSVAASGSDRVIIGEPYNNTGAIHAGSAYLFALAYPPLSITPNAAAVSLSWITPETGLILQQTDLLGTPTLWSDTTNSVSVNGLTNGIQATIVSGITNRFFPLRRP